MLNKVKKFFTSLNKGFIPITGIPISAKARRHLQGAVPDASMRSLQLPIRYFTGATFQLPRHSGSFTWYVTIREYLPISFHAKLNSDR